MEVISSKPLLEWFFKFVLGTQKVAIGSCMCFQANCGEIQPGFMGYY